MRRAFDLAWRAVGLIRTHSSSRCSVRRRAALCFSSTAEARLLLLEPGRVVALERDALAPVELEDPAGDVVEEVAIVGHRDHGALVGLEVPLEPGHRLGVEVVGRLVEQEQVGRREEQAAERDAAALAAGEGRHVAVALGQAERVHRAVERLVEAPGVGAVDPLLHVRLLGEQRVEVRIGLGEGRGDRVEAVEEVAQLADAVLDVAAHVLRPSSSGSWRRNPTVAFGSSSATPDDGSSRPAMIRSSVDLPAPFGPRTPIFAPWRNESEMPDRTWRSGP